MASLYEGRYNEVVHHAERYFPFSDWDAPPSEFLLIAMIAKEAARGKGFYDGCLKSLGAHKLSADHTFKIAKKCTVKVDHHFEKLHSDRCCGEVLVWKQFFPDAHLCLDLFHAIQRVVREISKKKKGSATAAKAFGMCFRGPGDKKFVRSESSRTQTFHESQPDNVPERVAH